MSGKSRTLRRVLLLALAVYLVCSIAAVQVMNAALFGRADEPDGLTVRYADVAADYPRQTVTFSSGSAQLTGWLYPAEDAAALVVIAHGLGADAETYLPETMHFVDSGYSVLTYDATGTGASGGSGTRGLAQSALDLDAALTRAEQEDLPILLFGHSWGGYAAAAVLGGSHDVTASVCAAGFDTPLGLMRQTARRLCGPVAELGVPFLWIDQRLRFGAAADVSGAKAAAASGVPVLVLHGSDDGTIPADGPSLLAACQKENAPNIRTVLLPGETHTSLLHDAQGRCSEAVFAQIDAFYAAALACGAG